MISKRSETVVGVFVVFTLLVLLAMVLTVAQQQRLWEKRVQYQAIFKNISGLKEGSEVRLAGVTVGSVTNVSFDAAGNIIVQFEVISQYRDRIREDSRATVGSIGLLGDMSLNITSGSAQVAALPPGGTLLTTEPLELSTFLERAAPALTDAQKILTNLVKVTDDLTNPHSNINRSLKDIQEILAKINQGKGTLGRVIGDAKLYDTLNHSLAEVDRFVSGFTSREGFLGTLLHDDRFNRQARSTMADLQASMENIRQAAASFREASTHFPGLMDKADVFLGQLNRAGVGLPGLVVSSQGFVANADKVAEAAQRTWLLRGYVPQAKERTIAIEK